MIRLAVLGDPLLYTRSPDLHRAGCGALGLACESRAIRVAPGDLGARLDALAGEGLLGVNLTHPLKEAALVHVARASDAARASRSINTIGFAAEWWGETTDGGGFVDVLREAGRDPAAERVVIFGAGGAARSVALALAGAGCAEVVVVSRDPAAAAPAWAAIPGARLAGGMEAAAAAARASLVVNATPRSSAGEPIVPGATVENALLVDLTYGPEPTAWVTAARAAGRRAMDGLGMLVHQARRSLSLWTGREVPVEPLARAVGWPR